MKLTDFALIFIGVTLPIIIIVYVNVSFTIKAEEQEMYYKKIINAALNDASDQMKEVENSDVEIDYGYSGTFNNKISVNAQVAVDTFLNSLYNNFGIKGSQYAENYLQYFIPAIAIIDYNGVQVSSIEEFNDNGQTVIKHALKPKKYYTYTYYIYKDANTNKLEFTDDYNVAKTKNNNSFSIYPHVVEFTMDDYITHRTYIPPLGNNKGTDFVSSFYMSDTKNNLPLINESVEGDYKDLDSEKKELLNKIVDTLKSKRKEIIIKAIESEMVYATNNNNLYASNAGIKYNFVFPTLEGGEMESQIKNVGMMALVQGISMGNRYLNVRAYSTSKLTEVTRYWLTIPKEGTSKYNMNLYHKDKNCPEYIGSISDNITPSYLFTKQQAASVTAVLKKNNEYRTLEGFYPCPICNP